MLSERRQLSFSGALMLKADADDDCGYYSQQEKRQDLNDSDGTTMIPLMVMMMPILTRRFSARRDEVKENQSIESSHHEASSGISIHIRREERERGPSGENFMP